MTGATPPSGSSGSSGSPGSQDLAAQLGRLAEDLQVALAGAHAARETALAACRRAIRACGASIRAVHRREWERAGALADEAAVNVASAQQALAPYPGLAASGPLHDAEKEYAEARHTAALVTGTALSSAEELGVGPAAWLNGLAEAASELRRYLLDRLREGELASCEALLAAMDEIYGVLVTIDYPDAVTGGLRRTTDALRAVLERTRGDLTTTVLQARLQHAIESQTPSTPPS